MLTLAHGADQAQHAEKRIQYFYIDIRDRVRTYGFVCLDASDDGDDRFNRFHFTVGMTESNLPELIVCGNLTKRSAQLLIERVAQELRRTKGKTPLGIRDDLAPVRLELRLIATPDNPVSDENVGMMRMLNELYPGRACVVQIVWTDAMNVRPADADAAPTRCRQLKFAPLPFEAGTCPSGAEVN